MPLTLPPALINSAADSKQTKASSNVVLDQVLALFVLDEAVKKRHHTDTSWGDLVMIGQQARIGNAAFG
jgi:hypothetical protein